MNLINKQSDELDAAYKSILEIICFCIFKSKTILLQSNFQRLPPAVNKIFYRYKIFTSQMHTELYLPFGEFIYLLD